MVVNETKWFIISQRVIEKLKNIRLGSDRKSNYILLKNICILLQFDVNQCIFFSCASEIGSFVFWSIFITSV